jgi:hypothetical protein
MGEVHMDKGRVGEDRGSKETDGCPLTMRRENVGRQRISKDGRRMSMPVRRQQHGERQKNRWKQRCRNQK